ncbi:MAG: protein of unknown function SprT [Gemmatimonadetes bacterium]|nr:protein of unknown function SprT [Gemmatimonadota bacterium]
MLFALKSVFGRRKDPAQLTFDLDAVPRSGDELLARLRALGLKRIEDCRLTRNRNVMVSFRGSELRVHEGYLSAPAEVHRAIVAFVEGRTRADRRAAQQRIVSHGVETPREPSRREKTRPEDEPLAAKFVEWHRRLNAEHFGGTLKDVPVRVSRRMQSRLGHYSAASATVGGEIAISWRHLRRHGWDEALHTLLHEMVHQWQDETGLPLDHGRGFRAKARAVGIEAAAKRAVRRPGAQAGGLS